MNKTDNEDKKKELKELLTEYYLIIKNIDQDVKDANIDGNIQLIEDTIRNNYVDLLMNKPDQVGKLEKIRNLKYMYCKVEYDEDTNEYKLMQNKYTIRDIEFNTGEEKVIKFDIGLVKSVGKKSKPKPIKPVKPVKSMPAPTPTKPNPTVIIESTTTPSSLYEDLGLDKLAAALL